MADPFARCFVHSPQAGQRVRGTPSPAGALRRALAGLAAGLGLSWAAGATEAPPPPAPDWFPYAALGANTYAFDRNSVRQGPGKLQLLVRMENKDSKQANIARIDVDCAADRFTLLSEMVDKGGRLEPLTKAVGKPLPVGNGFMRPLRNELCQVWEDPENVKWEPLTTEAVEIQIYVDQAFARNLPADGERGVFKTHVKVVAPSLSRMYQTRIDCRNSTQEFLGGLERERYIVRLPAEALAPINTNSAENILKHRYCHDEIAKRTAAQRRAMEEQQRARIAREEARQRESEETCARISNDAVAIMGKFTRMMENMDVPPPCRDLQFDFYRLRDLAREAFRNDCGRGSRGYQIHDIADKASSWASCK